jgi:hypothetical protein
MASDFTITIFGDYENIMLAVATGTRQMVWNGNHRLHGHRGDKGHRMIGHNQMSDSAGADGTHRCCFIFFELSYDSGQYVPLETAKP